MRGSVVQNACYTHQMQRIHDALHLIFGRLWFAINGFTCDFDRGVFVESELMQHMGVACKARCGINNEIVIAVFD